MEPSWHTMYRHSNWKHPTRPDQICLDFGKVTSRKDIVEGFYNAHEQRFVTSASTKIKANDPNIFQVKIAKYAYRNPKQQFWVPSMEPLPTEGKEVTHGGIYYDRKAYEKNVFSTTMYHSLPFERKIENKMEKIRHIEQATKNSRASLVPRNASEKRKKYQKEDIAMLVKLLSSK